MTEFQKIILGSLVLGLVLVAIFLPLINRMERRECYRWAIHPEEVRQKWQLDQCDHHGIALPLKDIHILRTR